MKLFTLLSLAILSTSAFATTPADNNPQVPNSAPASAPSLEGQDPQSKVFRQWVEENKFIGKIWTEGAIVKTNQINTITIIKNMPESLKSYKIRIIPEGSAVTMEYNSNRINFGLDKDNEITRIYVG